MVTTVTIPVPDSVHTTTIHVFRITRTSTMSASIRYRAAVRMLRKRSATVTIIHRRRTAAMVKVVRRHEYHQCHCDEHCSRTSSPFIWRGLAEYSANCCDLFIKKTKKQKSLEMKEPRREIRTRNEKMNVNVHRTEMCIGRVESYDFFVGYVYVHNKIKMSCSHPHELFRIRTQSDYRQLGFFY